MLAGEESASRNLAELFVVISSGTLDLYLSLSQYTEKREQQAKMEH
jgi:hypothetical protein